MNIFSEVNKFRVDEIIQNLLIIVVDAAFIH